MDANLWAAAFACRSRECTPLSISRYNGPRRSRLLTAHAFWEVTAVVAGRGELQGRTEVPLLPGMVLLVPPGWRHREHAPAGMETIWIGCRGSRLDAHPKRLVCVREPRLVEACERLWLTAQQTPEKIGPDLDGGLTLLLSALLRASQSAGAAARGDVIDAIIRYLHERLADPMRLAELARRAGCSEGHFSRLFHQRTGQSAVTFLNGLRIQQAVHLLEQTGLSISEIAARVGFASLFYFSRVFRRQTGQAPSAYRRRLMGPNTAVDAARGKP